MYLPNSVGSVEREMNTSSNASSESPSGLISMHILIELPPSCRVTEVLFAVNPTATAENVREYNDVHALI